MTDVVYKLPDWLGGLECTIASPKMQEGPPFITVDVIPPGETHPRLITLAPELLTRIALPMTEPPDGYIGMSRNGGVWQRDDTQENQGHQDQGWHWWSMWDSSPYTWEMVAKDPDTAPTIPLMPQVVLPAQTSDGTWSWTDDGGDRLVIEQTLPSSQAQGRAAYATTRPRGTYMTSTECREGAAVLLHLADVHDRGQANG